MSKKVYTEINVSGIRDFLTSKEVHELVDGIAKSIQSRAGDGYEMESRESRYRAVASVGAATFAAKADNKKNNTLLKAMGDIHL